MDVRATALHTRCAAAFSIDGVNLRELPMHHDSRGTVAEMFRAQWPGMAPALQWNYVRSVANVLRGVHVHHTHHDYLVVLLGRMLVGLCDLRLGHAGNACIVELRAERLQGLSIPPGVAHGFYLPEASVHVYAVSHYWDTSDELGCQWNDPGLGIPWPAVTPQLSARDQGLGSLATLRGQLADHAHGRA